MGSPGALRRAAAIVAVAALVVAVLVLGGCARPSGGTGPAGAGASPSSVGAGTTPTTAPGAGSPGAGSPASGGCVAGTQDVTVRKNEPPARTCLVVGARLHISTEPSPRHPWQPLSSSDSTVLSCTSKSGDAGTIDGTCLAVRAGTAVLTVVTRAAPGDTRYVPDYLWELTVRVVS
jgi:hypothetical protein